MGYMPSRNCYQNCINFLFEKNVQDPRSVLQLGDKRFRYWRFEDAMWRVRYMK